LANQHNGTVTNGDARAPQETGAGVSPTGVERRAEERQGVDLDVGLGSAQKFYSGVAENLSTHGIFIATHALKLVGESMDIRIFLVEQSLPLQVSAIVRWTRAFRADRDLPPGMGLSFTDLPPAEAKAIATFLQTLG